MTDINPQEADVPTENTKPATPPNMQDVDISIPDAPASIEVMQAYRDGIGKYEETTRYPSEWIARYHGVRECVLRGFVHIRGMDRITDALKKEDQTKGIDMDVVNFIVLFVHPPLQKVLNTFPINWVPKI